jgi:transcriptional regulator with XRE-family HTH domain
MISDNLKRILENKKIQAKDLANDLGISQTYLSYIMNDKRKPSFELLESLSIALNVPMSELVTESASNEIPDDLNLLVKMAEKLTPEQRQKMVDVAKAMFPETFQK